MRVVVTGVGGHVTSAVIPPTRPRRSAPPPRRGERDVPGDQAPLAHGPKLLRRVRRVIGRENGPRLLPQEYTAQHQRALSYA
jgi:hypothetical protein